MFHLVGSTGRTATSLIAECLDRLPGIAACHEGHQRDDDGPDLLPLVNLENFQVYRNRATGADVVAEKRSPAVIDAARRTAGADVIVDVAYYNAVLGDATLELHPEARLVGLIRSCESFVRSVTWLTGTDPMPVGWPDPDKEMSPRERFIGMGRLRPTSGHDFDNWPAWGAIERNIWLWRETNARLCDARDHWPDRVVLLDFGTISNGTGAFLRTVLDGLGLLGRAGIDADLELAVDASDRVNERTGGYQLGESRTWTESQRTMLRAATDEIGERSGVWTR